MATESSNKATLNRIACASVKFVIAIAALAAIFLGIDAGMAWLASTTVGIWFLAGFFVVGSIAFFVFIGGLCWESCK